MESDEGRTVTEALAALEAALLPAAADVDDVALQGAEIVGGWDASSGGWSIGLRATGSRLAVVGYRVAAAALEAHGGDRTPLTREDITVDGDGQLGSERFADVQAAVISAELSIATEFMEKLVLAFEVAFESGVHRALLDSR